MSDGGAFLAGSIIGKLVLDKMGWNSSVADVKKDEAVLTSHAAKIGKGFADVGKAMSVAGGVVVGGLIAMAKQTADTAGTLLVMSNKTGMSVEKLSAFTYAARVADSSIEDINQACKKMSMNMGAMTAGTGASGQALATLGLSVKDGQGKIKDFDVILLDVAEKFKIMPDGAQKSGLAIDLFGRSGQNMIPFLNKGRDGIGELTAEAEKFGLVMSREAAMAADEFGDQLTALTAGTKGISQQIAMSVMPTLTGFVLKLKDVVMGITGWLKEHPELAKVITGTALAVGGLLMVGGPLVMFLGSMIQKLPLIIGMFKSLTLAKIGTAAAIGTIVGLTVKYISLLTELKAAKDYEIEADARLQESTVKLEAKMHLLVTTGKMTEEAFQKMKAASGDASVGVDGWAGRMAMAIKKGEAGAVATAALAEEGRKHALVLEAEQKKIEDSAKALENKAAAIELAKAKQEAYTGFLNSLGIFTEEQHRAKLAEVNQAETDIQKLYASGKLSGEQYSGAIVALTADANKYGMDIQTKVTPPARDFVSVMGQAPKAMADAAWGYDDLDTAVVGLSKSLMVSEATIRIVLYELHRLALGLLNVKIPDLRVPPDVAPAVKKELSVIQAGFEGLYTRIAQGFGDTFGSFCETWSWDKIVNGKINFKEFFGGIWGNIKESFFTMVGELVTKWVTTFLKSLITDTAEAAGKAASSLVDLGTKATDVISGAASAAAGAVAGVAGSLINTISGVVSAAAAVVGLFKKTDYSPITDWLKLIHDLTKEAHDWILEIWKAGLRQIDIQDAMLADVRTGNGTMQAIADNTAKTVSAISGLNIPSYDVGTAHVPRTSLAVVHKGERIFNPATGGGASAGGPVMVNIRPILIDKGDKWMVKFIQEKLNNRGLRVPLATVGG
jgi:hypothetical protein